MYFLSIIFTLYKVIVIVKFNFPLKLKIISRKLVSTKQIIKVKKIIYLTVLKKKKKYVEILAIEGKNKTKINNFFKILAIRCYFAFENSKYCNVFQFTRTGGKTYTDTYGQYSQGTRIFSKVYRTVLHNFLSKSRRLVYKIVDMKRLK